ncbi:MAG: hypothetical protein HQL58_09855 [Magnetococcales bacterium]|nr:hypothetical protein [Magnetococcales bacterium]
MMRTVTSWLWQAVAYGAFCLPIWFLSDQPPYRYLQPNESEIKLAFKHAGAPVEECHKRTPEELQKLPPNMRAALSCSRERSPITIDILMDDQVITSHTFRPPGIHKDGSTFVYGKFSVPSGLHRMKLKMEDNVRHAGVDHTLEKQVQLIPNQILLIGFNREEGGFVVH